MKALAWSKSFSATAFHNSCSRLVIIAPLLHLGLAGPGAVKVVVLLKDDDRSGADATQQWVEVQVDDKKEK